MFPSSATVTAAASFPEARYGDLFGSRKPVHFLGFQRTVRQAGLVRSMGTVGDAFDNAPVEAFWARLQIELLNRKKWKTRVELSSAPFEYLEIFHNRTRRHSSLGMLTPIEYESVKRPTTNAA